MPESSQKSGPQVEQTGSCCACRRARAIHEIKQVGPPGQGPGTEASTFRENTDTQFGKKPVVTSAHPPVLDIRSDCLGDSLTGQISMS